MWSPLDGVPPGGQELPLPMPSKGCPPQARTQLRSLRGDKQAHGPGEAAITVSALTSLRGPRGRSGFLCPL